MIAAFLLLAFGRFARSEITHVGVPLRIATADAANANDIAFDDKHQVYLVVWSTASYSSPQGHTYGQFISADGARISTFLISQGEQAYATLPRVAYSSGSSDDVFLVVYGSDVNHPDATNLFGQLLRYNPTTNGPDFIASPATPPGSPTSNFPVSNNSGDYTYAQYAGGIAYNPTSRNFLVTWYAVGHGDDAWARLVKGDGTPVNNDKNLSAVPYSQGAPNVAFDPVNQRYLVVYSGDTADGLSIGIFSALIDGVSGDPIGNSMTPVSTGGDLEPFVLYLPELQTFLAGWTEMAASRDVVGRKVDANGMPYGAVSALVQTFAGGTHPLNEGAASGAYNPNTHSILIACMHDSGNIWGAELSGAGLPLQTLQLSTTVSTGAGSYTPRVAARANEFGFSYGLDFLAMYFERVQAGPGGATLSLNPSSPVAAGTPIVLTATTSRTTPQEFRFYRHDGTTWTIMQDYGPSNTCTWANPAAGNYSFQVWIRAAGSTNPWDQWAAATAVVTPAPMTVTVTPSTTAAAPGTPNTWTADATGGVAPAQYQFFIKNMTADTPWAQVQAYSTNNRWTLSAPTPGRYLVQVWARSYGSSQKYEVWVNSVLVDVSVIVRPGRPRPPSPSGSLGLKLAVCRVPSVSASGGRCAGATNSVPHR